MLEKRPELLKILRTQSQVPTQPAFPPKLLSSHLMNSTSGPHRVFGRRNFSTLTVNSSFVSSSEEFYSIKRRIFFDGLGKNLGITEWEDWYKISLQDLLKNGGRTYLKLSNM